MKQIAVVEGAACLPENPSKENFFKEALNEKAIYITAHEGQIA